MLDADRTDLGRLFQAIGPAVANARWPKLVRVLGTIRSPIVAERRRQRASFVLTWFTNSDKYVGAVPCSDLYTSRQSLNWIRWGILNQWSRSFIMRLTWSPLLHRHNILAASFMTLWSLFRPMTNCSTKSWITLIIFFTGSSQKLKPCNIVCAQEGTGLACLPRTIEIFQQNVI